MLILDRYLGFHFFTPEAGGKPDDVRQPHLGLGPPGGLYPDPAAFGVFSEIISTFSSKPCSAIDRWSSRPW
jgi:cytochrome o ubiquinol oxidase subunit 1